jgi:3-(methylthio)propanoyl-CoA dehydrogenase
MSYRAPIKEIRFALEHMAGLNELRQEGEAESLNPELLDAVFDAAARLAEDVLSPLQRVGDREGSRLENGVVVTPAGWREAYERYAGGGWNALPFAAEDGGQGLPWTIAMAVQEIWHGANTAFSLCPLLNQAAAELVTRYATQELRARYLPKLVSGEWTGAMSLTEPQAGSDLGAIRTRAWRDGETWRLQGQKIFITYGEHDLTENIVHLVLARTPNAPAGTHGLSLFLIPKFLPGADGTPGERNDLRCVSLEEKLGIHASPTCLMAYGDSGGATAFLIGEESRGIEAMFTMMNNARLGVGVQATGIAERAAQMARAYAAERVQGREIGGSSGKSVKIIQHPDIRRMLLTMRARIEAMRGLALSAALAIDLARRHSDPERRRLEQERADLLTPMVKAWCTDSAVEIASLALQVHGGMGFIEETGIAQVYRDARITPIYEGTNGIQAQDLVFRKVGRDAGAAARRFIHELGALAKELQHFELRNSVAELEHALDWLLSALQGNPREAAAVSTPFLRLCATVAGGAILAKGAAAAQSLLAQPESDRGFLQARIAQARFYAQAILPEANSIASAITTGAAAATLDATDEAL